MDSAPAFFKYDEAMEIMEFYAIADLSSYMMMMMMMWTHKSIQHEGLVCTGQLSICAQMLSTGLRQKNQNNVRKGLYGRAGSSLTSSWDFSGTLVSW